MTSSFFLDFPIARPRKSLIFTGSTTRDNPFRAAAGHDRCDQRWPQLSSAPAVLHRPQQCGPCARDGQGSRPRAALFLPQMGRKGGGEKRAVRGKSGTVRVILGGRRYSKTKQK